MEGVPFKQTVVVSSQPASVPPPLSGGDGDASAGDDVRLRRAPREMAKRGANAPFSRGEGSR